MKIGALHVQVMLIKHVVMLISSHLTSELKSGPHDFCASVRGLHFWFWNQVDPTSGFKVMARTAGQLSFTQVVVFM